LVVTTTVPLVTREGETPDAQVDGVSQAVVQDQVLGEVEAEGKENRITNLALFDGEPVPPSQYA
jgi:hypothetical protein